MDRRIERTRRALQNAYVALRRQQPTGTISVAAITTLADVGRGTFYLHYKDVAALEAAIVAQMTAQLVAQLEPAKVKRVGNSYRQWLGAMLAWLRTQRPLLDLISATAQADQVTQPVEAALVRLLMQLTGRNPLDHADRVAITFAAAGLVGTTRAWLAGTLAVPEVALVTELDAQLQALTIVTGGQA